MRIPRLGFENDLPAAVVLGAGASRGASFVGRTGVLPPLDADFFDQVQRLPSASRTTRDRDLLQFVRTEFGSAGYPTLETFFTQIAAVDRFHHEFNIRGRVSTKFGKQLTSLRGLIPRVFEESVGSRLCRWHARIAAALRAGDAVLSFNYDCLIDDALRSEAGKRWRADSGYGFRVSGGDALWSPPRGPGAPVKSPIRLLKPHGSLNWSLSADRTQLGLVHAYMSETQHSVVPPTWNKTEVAEWPWNEVWRQARKALAQARLMIVVGYSVPVTDQLSQALLRADVTSLKGLICVNPDRIARQRVRELFSSAVTASTQVVELETLADLSEYLPPAPSERAVVNVEDALDSIDRLVRQLQKRVGAIESLVADIETRQIDTDEQAGELRVDLDEIVDSLERLQADLPDADEFSRIEGVLGDLEARLDTFVVDARN